VKTQRQTQGNVRGKLSPELSERISILRLPLIVGVVFLHTYDVTISRTVTLHYTGWLRFVSDYISEGVATTSVPLFFLLSGYLFFWRTPLSQDGFLAKMLKSVKALVVPLILWNTLCLVATATAEALPTTARFVSGRSAPVSSFGWLDYSNALFGLTTHPIAYQFWFIRDLVVLVLLSPLIYFAMTKAAIPFFAIVTAWWFSVHVPTLPILSREAILFFSAGSLLAIRRINLCDVDRVALPAFMLYLPISVGDALMKQQAVSNAVHKVAEVCGIVCVFCAGKYVRQSAPLRKTLITLSSASFFVFACHEPLLTIARKLSFALLSPSSERVVLALYFVDPLLVIVVCIVVYYVCWKMMPEVTSLLTGGRSKTVAVSSVSASSMG
jgi:surface polysaccharide O-acyltransferase-like enzyme